MTEKNMKWKLAVLVIVAVLALSAVLVYIVTRPPAQWIKVAIKEDGSIEPPTVSILRDGDTYIFTGDVYAGISVQKSNITIDGAGYTLSGPYNGTHESAFIMGEGPDQVPEGTIVPYSIGIDLAFPTVEGLTVKNLNIKNFSMGMYIWTKNNMVTENAITNSIVGVLLSGENNRITRNLVARNTQGVFFGWTETGAIPEGIEISHNSFDNNVNHLSGCLCEEYNLTEGVHTWDDGAEGNYWSDYNGTDQNNDGIGDTRYEIDVLNIDRYPLMQSQILMQEVAQAVPSEALLVASAAILAVAAFLIALKKGRKNAQQQRKS